MQSQGVLGSAKHFPGHGDTATDSHLNLPVITADRERLDREELLPFKALIEADIASVMVAHIALESITGSPTTPASLSYKVSTELLQEQMGYQGLVITDALNMKGVSKSVNVDQVALEALLAGADILLYPENVSASIQVLKEAYASGRLTEDRLAHSVKKILKAKYRVGLNRFDPLSTDDLASALNATADELLTEEIYEAAITTVLNSEDMLPLSLDQSYLFVAIGEQADRSTAFAEMLKRYAHVDRVQVEQLNTLNTEAYAGVIVGHFGNTDTPWKNSKISTADWELIHRLSEADTPLILAHFGTPYTLFDLQLNRAPDALLVGYQNREASQRALAQILFGALPSKGVLPVEIEISGQQLGSI